MKVTFLNKSILFDTYNLTQVQNYVNGYMKHGDGSETWGRFSRFTSALFSFKFNLISNNTTSCIENSGDTGIMIKSI